MSTVLWAAGSFVIGVVVGCRAGGLPWVKSLVTGVVGWIGVVVKEVVGLGAGVVGAVKGLLG